VSQFELLQPRPFILSDHRTFRRPLKSQPYACWDTPISKNTEFFELVILLNWLQPKLNEDG